jgi:hypothetical protein
MDLNNFISWQAEKTTRSVDIKIQSDFRGDQTIRAFVYDTAVSAGQVVRSVEEIDLLGDIKRRELEELNRLQKKYGGAP